MALARWNDRDDPELYVVDKLLYTHGEQLKAPEEFRSEGMQLADNVFRKLQQESKLFSVAEVHFGGSFGKNTDVLQPDLDLIIVLNDLEVTREMREKALDEFQDILIMNQDELQIQEEPRLGTRTLKFQFTNGMKVDLLPAAKISPDKVYAELRKNPEKYYEYNTSLIAKHLEFLTSHDSSFVHVMIRLAKFWQKSLNFGEKKFEGGSVIMELLAIAAAEEEEERYGHRKSVVHTLTKIMEMIMRIDSIKLAFQKISEKKWKRVPVKVLKFYGNEHKLIPRVVGTRKIFRKKGFIIDSANPFYDLLGNVEEEVIVQLKEFAQETRDRIEKLLTDGNPTLDSETDEEEIDISMLFRPQPINLQPLFPSSMPDDLLVTYWHEYTSTCCSMEVRNEDVMRVKEIRKVIESIKWNLLAAVNTVLHSFRDCEEDDKEDALEDAMKDMIESNFNEELETAENESHDVMDVTLIVPYNNGYGVKLSMTWN